MKEAEEEKAARLERAKLFSGKIGRKAIEKLSKQYKLSDLQNKNLQNDDL